MIHFSTADEDSDEEAELLETFILQPIPDCAMQNLQVIDLLTQSGIILDFPLRNVNT